MQVFNFVQSTSLLAYLDPSAGSMAFQVLMASLLTGMFYFRATMGVIKQRLSGFSK